MRDVLSFWWKLTAALTIGGGSFILLNSCEEVHDICLGTRTLWFNACGNDAGYERLVTETQRTYAYQQGLGEWFERSTTRQQMIGAFRELDRMDPQLADDALHVILEERFNRAK